MLRSALQAQKEVLVTQQGESFDRFQQPSIEAASIEVELVDQLNILFYASAALLSSLSFVHVRENNVGSLGRTCTSKQFKGLQV